MFSVLQPPTRGLEVLATELTHDVRRVALGAPVGSALDPWSHAFDFVLDQGLPVFAVDITFLAVEVSGVVTLVSLHCLLIVERLEAAFDVAWHGLDGLEWDYHLVGLEGGEVVVANPDGGWCVFVSRSVVCVLWMCLVVLLESWLGEERLSILKKNGVALEGVGTFIV